MTHTLKMIGCSMLLAYGLPRSTVATAATVPFTEEFALDEANWFNAPGNAPLSWDAAGGPDGGSYAFGTFNFVSSMVGNTPVQFRAQDEFGSSGGAFEGDWINDGVTSFSAFVRHDAGVPLTFFTRFSAPANFPGAVALSLAPVPSDTWTQITFSIDAASPQFISFGGSSFATIFSNIGHVQVGVSVPESLAGLDETFMFSIDKPTIVPEPAALAAVVAGGLILTRRRRQGTEFPAAKQRSALPFAVLAGSLVTASAAQAADFSFNTPSDDRWHYPFNFTPGLRPTASCFGAAAIPGFNDRDGAVIVAWDTTASIPPGLGADAYNVQSVQVVITNQKNAQWPIDLTTDEWFTFDLNGDTLINADGVPRGEGGDTDGESDDTDPGRPIELFGAGFGPTYMAQSWFETSIYVGSTGESDLPRDPFPFVYQDATGDILHVEDCVKGLHNESLAQPVFEFTPTPWAVGTPLAYTPGAQPIPFDVAFEVDFGPSDGDVRAYFQEQLNEGRVFVIITTLREAAFMGPNSGFPSFFMKEGLFLDPLAKAAQLIVTLCDAGQADLDGDGDTDLADFAEFGVCFSAGGTPAPGCESADLDCDNDADLADYDVFEAQFAGPSGP